MQSDFSKRTIDTLAKRAAYRCSNPDCRVLTVGPNSEVNKSTIIGEAAHIFGARPNAKRYNPKMTDAARAEITNAIWLCRNCHKLIDTDDQKYTSEVLFEWRERHEQYTQSELGNATDRIQYEKQISKLSLFLDYPPIIRRIVIDKPEGWEWRLSAELMRYFNQPLFRQLEDIRDGLYIKNQRYIDDEEVIKWVQMQLAESSNLVNPLVVLLDRLTKSFGPPGKPGNEEEIHHITCLIRDHLKEIIRHEEKIHFVIVPDKYKKLVNLLKNLIGSQVTKLAEIPESLNETVSLIGKDHGGTEDDPYIVKKTITFDVPKGWSKQFNRELRRVQGASPNGCLAIFIVVIIIWILATVL